MRRFVVVFCSHLHACKSVTTTPQHKYERERESYIEKRNYSCTFDFIACKQCTCITVHFRIIVRIMLVRKKRRHGP